MTAVLIGSCGDDSSTDDAGDAAAFCDHATDVADALTALRASSSVDARSEIENVLDGFIGLEDTAPSEIAADASVVAGPARDARQKLDDVPADDTQGAFDAVDFEQTEQDREAAERMEAYIDAECDVTLPGS